MFTVSHKQHSLSTLNCINCLSVFNVFTVSHTSTYKYFKLSKSVLNKKKKTHTHTSNIIKMKKLTKHGKRTGWTQTLLHTSPAFYLNLIFHISPLPGQLLSVTGGLSRYSHNLGVRLWRSKGPNRGNKL